MIGVLKWVYRRNSFSLQCLGKAHASDFFWLASYSMTTLLSLQGTAKMSEIALNELLVAVSWIFFHLLWVMGNAELLAAIVALSAVPGTTTSSGSVQNNLLS